MTAKVGLICSLLQIGKLVSGSNVGGDAFVQEF
jgi:hypothetical protein